jgi:glycosyltransferase involved in cell wall biosynthesis
MWVIDARQLTYAGTGLASVTAEILRVLAEKGAPLEFAVVADARVDPAAYLLDENRFVWIRISMQEKGPDFIDRIRWSRAVLRELKKRGIKPKLFLPYLYNYGNRSENVVWIPDLLYRIIPFADYASAPFWAIRKKFYLRRLMMRLEEKWVAQARRFVCYSDFVRKHACEVLGVGREKFLLAPLAPGQTLMKWRQAEEEPLPVELPGRFALYVGGLGFRKNVPMLVRACGEVAKQVPDFRCVFVGLTHETVARDQAFQTIFEDEGVRKAVVFCPKISDRELAHLYRRCEFTLYPSCNEGFGLPIVEAAAFGKLCLCADNSSMKEIQFRPEYRIETDNQEAWSKAIREFWSSPSQLERAEPYVAELAGKYDWVRTGIAVMELLRSLDNKKR